MFARFNACGPVAWTFEYIVVYDAGPLSSSGPAVSLPLRVAESGTGNKAQTFSLLTPKSRGSRLTPRLVEACRAPAGVR